MHFLKRELNASADITRLLVYSSSFIIIIIIVVSVLPKGRSFTANSGTKAAILPKGGLPLQTQEPRLQVY